MFQGLQKYRVVYRHLWQTYGQSWAVRVSYILQILSRACKIIALPIAVSIIITKLSTKDFHGAYMGVLLFAVFSLSLGIMIPITKYIGMRGENPVYRDGTADYFSKLVHTDLDYFHANMAGYLTAATRQYVDSTLQLVRAIRDKYITTVLTIVFPLLVICWIDRWLGLIAFVLNAIQAIYLIWASNTLTPLREKARDLYKENSGRVADIISNILAVRSSAQEAIYTEQIRAGAAEESDAFTNRYTKQAKLIAGRECITVIIFMILLWLTVQRMSGGHISITAAVLVVTYTTTILTGIYSLSDELDEHDDWVDKIIPAFDILDRTNKVLDPRHPKKLGKVKGDIQLNDVTFCYEVGQPVLKSFSLHIPHGQKAGIVGLSGAGKSTLARLLLRFNDVGEGEILLDGIDVRKVRQTDLRSQIAYVPQEPLLFHTTIKENVLLSQPNATDTDVKKALRSAHALHFIEQLPDGIASIVGERGVKLSGGQKQRVAIARAVLRKAPIMILDEATSALDSESEQIIKDSFSEILKGKTAIVIAHRLSTLSEMDRIIVIESGQCVEDGTHKQLLKKGGVYARLWRRQLRDPDE
jgi:ATP-binding cassette subfamily B protein